jgi:hypothetical protein
MSTGRTSEHRRHSAITGAAAGERPDINRLTPTRVLACTRGGCKRALGHHRGIHGGTAPHMPGTRAQRRTALRARLQRAMSIGRGSKSGGRFIPNSGE